MANKRKGNAPGAAILDIELPDEEGKSALAREEASILARVVMYPHTQAAFTIRAFEGTDHSLQSLADELRGQIDAVHSGDMKRAESMLITQAHTLNELFHYLARKAAMNMGEYMGAMETYMRLAFKAQSQCRATLETLATIKNPPVIYARQANVTTGPQQVNNGVPSPSARETEIEQNKVLEEKHGERLDTGTAGATGGHDSELAPVGQINRAKDISR